MVTQRPRSPDLPKSFSITSVTSSVVKTRQCGHLRQVHDHVPFKHLAQGAEAQAFDLITHITWITDMVSPKVFELPAV